MIMVNAALQWLVANVDVVIFCEKKFFKRRIVFSTVQMPGSVERKKMRMQVSFCVFVRPELIVVTDHSVNRVPDYQDKFGLVVSLP